MNVPYAVLEGLVAIGAAVGNSLVIVAFRRERRLRRRTNYYIVSLAVADLLVGLVGIPCAVLASVGLPRHLHMCVFSVSLIIVLCTVSILSLVAVSADRYWAILYPMAYSTNSNTKIAVSTYARHYLRPLTYRSLGGEGDPGLLNPPSDPVRQSVFSCKNHQNIFLC